jgi:hypothetical protein
MRSFILALSLLFPLAAWPADKGQPFDVRPGLWKINYSSLYTQPAEPRMTAESRRMSDSAPSGIDAYPPQDREFEMCVVKDAFAESFLEAYYGRPGRPIPGARCTQETPASSASNVKVKMKCTWEKRVAAVMVFERVNAEAVKGAGTVTSYHSFGPPSHNPWSVTGKFVSPDCGKARAANQ